MRFGVTVPNYRRLASRENLIGIAQRSEELGFDSVWVTDHVVVPEAYREMFGTTVYDPLSVMAFVAAHTQRVKIGTAVLVIPYRNPLVVAKQLATIDNLSNGRLLFGTGAGWAREEFDALGVPHDQRGPITDEYLRAILQVWTTQGAVSFEGQYVNFKDMHAEPRPVQQPHPPLLIGGYGKKAIRRAVAIGQGWFPDGMSLSVLEPLIGFMHQTAEAAGRDPASLSVTLRTGLFLEDREYTDDLPFRGSVERVIDDIRAAARIGVDELVFESPVQRGDERMDTIEHFAAEVMPTFREVGATRG